MPARAEAGLDIAGMPAGRQTVVSELDTAEDMAESGRLLPEMWTDLPWESSHSETHIR